MVLAQLGRTLGQSSHEVSADPTKRIAAWFQIGMLRVDGFPTFLAAHMVIQDFPHRHRGLKQALAGQCLLLLFLAGRSELLGTLMSPLCCLDSRGGESDQRSLFLGFRFLCGDFVCAGRFGTLFSPPRRLIFVLGNRRLDGCGMAVPARHVLLCGLHLAGDVDERREPLLQPTHCVASPFQARQVREFGDMLGEHRTNRIGLCLGHGHGQELSQELRLAPEV